MKAVVRGTCTAALLAVTLAGFWAAAHFPVISFSLRTGLAVAFSLVLSSYWSLVWAMGRSDKLFFSFFAGGVLFRLSGLAVLAYVSLRSPALSPPASLLSCVGGLILLTAVELFFIQKESHLRV